MILSLLLLLTAQTAGDEIVVIGKRFSGIQVIVGKDARGRFTCGLSESSGNARLDARLCKAAAKCVVKGSGARDCIEQRKPALLADFRREWLSGGAR